MFDSHSDAADEKGFVERGQDDRHHFRFIVSPEEATKMVDLKVFTRDLVAEHGARPQDEARLGRRRALEHRQPAVHLLVRGKADDGQNLVISRDYISHGMRASAEELVMIARAQERTGGSL